MQTNIKRVRNTGKFCEGCMFNVKEIGGCSAPTEIECNDDTGDYIWISDEEKEINPKLGKEC